MASCRHVWSTDGGGTGEHTSEPEKTHPVLKECAKTQEMEEGEVSGWAIPVVGRRS